MAETIPGVDTTAIVGGVTSAADTLVVGMIIIFIIAIILGLIFFIFNWLSYKHTIILRAKTKGHTDMIITDKYKYIKKKGEPEKIRLYRLRQFKPCPPESAKDFTSKGREFVEGWIVDTGEVRYVESEINDIKYVEEENKPKGQIKFEPIDTDDKEFYANELFTAQRFKNKSILEWISANAGLIAIIMIFLIVVVFWSDITAPMIKVADSNAAISKQNAEIVQSLEAIFNDKQFIEPEATAPD